MQTYILYGISHPEPHLQRESVLAVVRAEGKAPMFDMDAFQRRFGTSVFESSHGIELAGATRKLAEEILSARGINVDDAEGRTLDKERETLGRYRKLVLVRVASLDVR